MTLFDTDGTVSVLVSAASARQQFHGCEPGYIEQVCHGRCCQSATAPRGIVVTIHASEADAAQAIRDLGGAVDEHGLVVPRPGSRRCPAHMADGLCGLHTTGWKPFGCTASPFTLSKRDVLVVRNRYRLLRCYRQERRAEWGDPGGDGPALPAYRAFRGALVAILGERQTDDLTRHLDAGGGDYAVAVPRTIHQMLRENDAVKHYATEEPS
jgi:hypothetical protein